MAAKRKAENGDPPSEESDLLTIRPLGAGQEVGRSCIMLEYKNKKIMLDCGIHPGLSGMDSLPYTDMIEADEIDLLLITHFHLDHCGALPWFLEKTTFKGRVFMTHATKAVYRWLLSDYIKVSNIASDQMLFSEKDLEKSMEKIETINFHQEVDVNGVRFWCYNAGHVLGAAMFMIEIAGVKVLYTGDFSCEEDRHLMAAEIPSVTPDILISEATFGIHVHEKREAREMRFTSTIHDIVTRGGRCLIPVFALGRAQELLLILDDYWASHPELHDIPIYYASSLAKKCMAVYQTFIGAMNQRIQKLSANPFVFKHISNLKSVDQFDDLGPCVIMASPGMMQSGLSRQLFEAWCTDKKNGVLIAGYCVEGTLAKHVMTEPSEVVTLTGQKLPLRMSVDYISFAAHTDYDGTSNFIKTLKPPHVVLVHGEANEMGRLKAALLREFEDNEETNIEIYTPRNTQAVELYFRGEKMAKVMGVLAKERPVEGQEVSGVLVKRGFNYHLIDPSDLSSYTDLAISSITQRQVVSCHASLSLLSQHLSLLAPDTTMIMVHGRKAIKMFDGAVMLLSKDDHIIIEWTADSVTDMYADAVLAVVLQVESSPLSIDSGSMVCDKKQFPGRLLKLLQEMYGPHNVSWAEDNKLAISVDSNIALVDTQSLEVEGGGESLNHSVATAAKRLHSTLHSSHTH